MVKLNIELPDGFLDEEVRCGFTVSAEKKRLWAIELDLLSETDRICRKYGIRYMATGGTLLGAIRHGGFIPWDDDIDLFMTRDNYVRFREVAQHELKHPYFMQDGYSDISSVRGHIQIRNSLTTAIRKNELKSEYPFNQGIFIDVFPLDCVPDEDAERNRFLQKIKKKRIRAIKISRLGHRYTPAVRGDMSVAKRVFRDLLHLIVSCLKLEEKSFKNYETFLQSYNNQICLKVGAVCNYAHPGILNCEYLQTELLYVPFEFLEIPVSKNFEDILSWFYGDWRQYSIGTSIHGELIIDTDIPYTQFFATRASFSGDGLIGKD